MSTYKPGKRTQKALIESAKILFYQKGYNNTSVKDICDMADVPLNSITYHFKGKDRLAALIYNELYVKVIEYTQERVAKEIFEEKPYLKIMVSYAVWWNLVLSDPHFHCFMKDLYGSRIAQKNFLDSGAMGDGTEWDPFFSFYEKSFGKILDEAFRQILKSAYMGMESELLIGYGELFSDKEKMLHYIFRTRLTIFIQSDEQFEGIYRECMQLVDTVELDMDYFANFAYGG